MDASLQGDQVSSVAGSYNSKDVVREEHAASKHDGTSPSAMVKRQTSSTYSYDNGGSSRSSDARETALAREEFRRFSYEAEPRLG